VDQDIRQNEITGAGAEVRQGPVFIGIAGGTASGKTTLVNVLLERLADIGVSSVCFDSYYRELAHLSFETRDKFNFDAPEAFDTELFQHHLRQLRAGEQIPAPIYDYAQHLRKAETVPVPAETVVLCDGILLLHDEGSRKMMDLRIFVHAEAELRFKRRIERDVRERGRTKESVEQWWHERVQPSHLLYCEPTREFADLLVEDRDTWSLAEEKIRALVRARKTAPV